MRQAPDATVETNMVASEDIEKSDWMASSMNSRLVKLTRPAEIAMNAVRARTFATRDSFIDFGVDPASS